MDDEDDPDSYGLRFTSIDQMHKFQERQPLLVRTLAEKFIEHGFAQPSTWHLGRLAALNHSFGRRALVQDTGSRRDGRPDTRKPVEMMLTALKQVVEAYAECERTAQIETSLGRLNVAREFIDQARYAHEFPTLAALLSETAEETLKTGKKPQKREPLLPYDEFIGRVMDALGDKAPNVRSAIIDLLIDCEFILPLSLRAKTEPAVGDRFDAFVKRCKDKWKMSRNMCTFSNSQIR